MLVLAIVQRSTKLATADPEYNTKNEFTSLRLAPMDKKSSDATKKTSTEFW